MSALERWRTELVPELLQNTYDGHEAQGIELARLTEGRTVEQVIETLGAECDPWSEYARHSSGGRILHGKRRALAALRQELKREILGGAS